MRNIPLLLAMALLAMAVSADAAEKKKQTGQVKTQTGQQLSPDANTALTPNECTFFGGTVENAPKDTCSTGKSCSTIAQGQRVSICITKIE